MAAAYIVHRVFHLGVDKLVFKRQSHTLGPWHRSTLRIKSPGECDSELHRDLYEESLWDSSSYALQDDLLQNGNPSV